MNTRTSSPLGIRSWFFMSQVSRRRRQIDGDELPRGCSVGQIDPADVLAPDIAGQAGERLTGRSGTVDSGGLSGRSHRAAVEVDPADVLAPGVAVQSRRQGRCSRPCRSSVRIGVGDAARRRAVADVDPADVLAPDVAARETSLPTFTPCTAAVRVVPVGPADVLAPAVLVRERCYRYWIGRPPGR